MGTRAEAREGLKSIERSPNIAGIAAINGGFVADVNAEQNKRREFVFYLVKTETRLDSQIPINLQLL